VSNDEIISLARQYSVRGLEFDRTSLLEFVSAFKRSALDKQRIKQIYQRVPPSYEFWYAYAKAIEQAHGITE
jgi:hypothetical protein